MERIVIVPANKAHWLEMRHRNLNSTEISALYGCNPYMTEFELWHHKKAQEYVGIDETDRMKWGSRLQDAIANGVAADNCWVIRSMPEYITLLDHRVGSSFDYLVNDNTILEIKNVDNLVFNKNWTEDEAPPQIELQVQTQMLVSGHKKAYICALVGGNTVHLIERDYIPSVGESILKQAARFWKSIDDNEPPAPNFERDAEFISSLYNYADPNKTMEADERIDILAERYRVFSEGIKELEGNREATKAELLTLIGDAEKCRGSNFTISAGITGEAQVSFTRKAFRSFRVSFRKGKNEPTT